MRQKCKSVGTGQTLGSVAMVAALLAASAAHALINPTFTPIHLVKQSKLIMSVDLKQGKAIDQYDAVIREVLKGKTELKAIHLDLSKARNRKTFEREWVEAVRRDWNHPSIIAWTPFNERRGDFLDDPAQQRFVAHIRDLNHELDPTRPAIDNDGYCHVATDIVTIHDYSPPETLAATWGGFGPGARAKHFPSKVHEPHFAPGGRYRGEPVILSEVAGVWHAPKAETKGWGYGDKPATVGEYVRRYRDTIWAVMRSRGVRGFCVTQLTDVEQEQNGLYYSDRSEKVPPEVFAAIHAGPSKWRNHPGADALRRILGD